MLVKLKKLGIIVACIVGFIIVIGLLILTAGKNRQIKKLLETLTNTWKKNIAGKEIDNIELDKTFAALSAQEQSIIKAIQEEPDLKLPDNIDPTDYKAMLIWFNELEKHYS